DAMANQTYLYEKQGYHGRQSSGRTAPCGSGRRRGSGTRKVSPISGSWSPRSRSGRLIARWRSIRRSRKRRPRSGGQPRSGVVRMRVLEHVRRRGRPESWRAGRDHMAALLTRLGFPDLAEDLWETAIRLDAPGPWVGLGQAQVAGGFLNEAAKSFDRAIQMGDTSALLNRAEALGAGGDYDLAIAACESYLASHPTDLRALAMKADFLVRSGFKEEAARI